jgi:hypothetical protein
MSLRLGTVLFHLSFVQKHLLLNILCYFNLCLSFSLFDQRARNFLPLVDGWKIKCVMCPLSIVKPQLIGPLHFLYDCLSSHSLNIFFYSEKMLGNVFQIFFQYNFIPPTPTQISFIFRVRKFFALKNIEKYFPKFYE